ncbi:MAG: T9SS type A sorting domain-containing protein [Bacteroidales bacterium]|nr:T9SS type A sorting domain-containing protein [Bacteroidales bacterium]
MIKRNILSAITLVIFINIFCDENVAQNNCASAINISSLPYSDSRSTCGAGSDYGSGQACLDVNFTGEDVVYKFTPVRNMCVNFVLKQENYVWDGVSCLAPYEYPGACPAGCSSSNSLIPCICWVCNSNLQPTEGMGLALLNNCPDAGGACIDKDYGYTQVNVNKPAGIWVEHLTAGLTYYIIVDEKSTSKCHTYTFTVNEIACPDPAANCAENFDFEFKDFTNWTGGVGTCCPIGIYTPGILSHGINSPNNEGLGCLPGSGGGTVGVGDDAAQHTITAGQGTDPYTGNAVKVVSPFGGNFSSRVGNADVCAYASQLCHNFIVTPGKTALTLMYACVFEDPSHTSVNQPRFQIDVKDPGDNIITCGNYYLVAAAGIPGFQSYSTYNGSAIVYFKNWSYVAMDLSPYLGQVLKLCFSTGDCSQTGHFGYAYVDAECRPLTTQGFTICSTGNPVQFCAPPGYSGWTWSTGAKTECITVSNPIADTIYTVTIISASGCPSVIKDTIKVFQADAWGSQSINCGGSITINSSANDYANYSWSSNPPGFMSVEQNPVVSPKETTTYTVTVSPKYGYCSVQKEVVVTVANGFSVNISKTDASCIGCSDGTAKAEITGGTPQYTYLWNTFPSQTTDSISGLSKGTYCVVITDNAGCQMIKCVTIDEMVGITDIAEKTELLIYPNPTNDKFYVKFENKNNSTIKLQITDLLGKIVFSETSNFSSNKIIDLSKQPDGMYLLQIQTENKIYNFKIFKNN